MKMKQKEQESGRCCVKRKQMSSSPSPPPPPPPFPRFLAKKSVVESVTKREIDRFWTLKRINEEEHFLAAIKAAARIRARKLSEEDYRSFEDSLNDEDNDGKDSDAAVKTNENKDDIRVGIKDWWTKSKYAYLNQLDMDSKSLQKGVALHLFLIALLISQLLCSEPLLVSFKPNTPELLQLMN